MRRVSVALGVVAVLASVTTRAGAPALGTPVWEKSAPIGPTPNVGDFAMAFDAANGRGVLFGGADPASVDTDDTWTWSGTSWKREAPSTRPPARHGAAMAYDALRNRAVLYGGATCDPASGACTSFDDAWQWDGTTWSRLVSPGPSARLHFAFAYDARRDKAVLFGGCTDDTPRCATPLGDTWEYDGVWTLTATTGPPPAAWVAATFDGARRNVVLFGGESFSGARDRAFGETWIYDGAWTKATPAASPEARFAATLAYDEARKRVVLFGGLNCLASCRAYDATYEWDGAFWVRRTPSPAPPPTATGVMGFDAIRRRVELVAAAAGVEAQVVWDYWNFADSCRAADECDTAQCSGGVCCKIACPVCADCDFTGTECLPVRRRDDPDSCTDAMTCDSDARCKKKLGQPCAQPSDCASGLCTGGACCGVDACERYACGADGRCLTACASNKECAPGFTCAAQACVAVSVRCEGDTAVAPDGARSECAPYACGAQGCLRACNTSDECSAGLLCNGAGACVNAPLAGAVGCGVARAPCDGRWLALALVAAAAGRRRRAR